MGSPLVSVLRIPHVQLNDLWFVLPFHLLMLVLPVQESDMIPSEFARNPEMWRQ